MARDYAKRKPRPARRSAARARPSAGISWRAYFAGVMTGVLGSVLLYLTALPGPGEQAAVPAAPGLPAPAASTEPAPEAPPKPRFDFYTMLTEDETEAALDPEVEPAADLGQQPDSAAAGEQYLLQAGSFRQSEDAERRRAELLLLGLEPSVEATSGDDGRWHRVFLGPFTSRNEMQRVRGLTAGQQIETLMLRRGGG